MRRENLKWHNSFGVVMGIACLVAGLLACSDRTVDNSTPDASVHDGAGGSDHGSASDGGAPSPDATKPDSFTGFSCPPTPSPLCTTALCEARQLIRQGDFSAAYQKYHGESSAEAELGAATTKLVLLLQSQPVTDLLAKLNLPPFDPSQLFGYRGWFSEYVFTKNEPSTAQLHPLWSDPESALLDKGFKTTLGQALEHVRQLAPELEDIGQHFYQAADQLNAGQTAPLPGELYCGNDLPLTKGDLILAASFMQLFAGTVLIMGSYDSPLELGWLLCDQQCLSNASLVEKLNASMVTLRTAHSYAQAEKNFKSGLLMAQMGLAVLEDKSLVPKTASTTAGVNALFKLVNAAALSLDNGTAIPDVSPELILSLKKLFSAPPDPSKINIDPFVCEGSGSSCEIVAVESYFKELLDGIVSWNWDDLSYSQESQLETLAEEITDILEQYFPL